MNDDAPLYYLIESGETQLWYCGANQWCNNACHAIRFPTAKTAREYIVSHLENHPAFRVTEHQWFKVP